VGNCDFVSITHPQAIKQRNTNTTMKYRLTPFNIICGLATGLAIYSAIISGPEGWGFLVTIYLIPLIIIGLLFDFLLQRKIFKYPLTVIIELFILITIYFSYCWTQRTKTLVIPDKLQGNYVVTIYGVEKSAKLPGGWNYKIQVPTDGIVLTSSAFEEDLRETKMITYSGINLNSDKTNLGWVRVTNDELVCNGKIYKYQFWMVANSCCGYSNHDIDNFKLTLQRQFCSRSQ
jgi:hypothetical protein